MDIKTLNTQYGSINIYDPDKSLLKELQERLTYGFYPLGQEFQGCRYGFVVRCGDNEIPCIKLQPADMSKDMAEHLFTIHSCLILETYCKLRKKNYDMIYYATPYIKDKRDGKYESGIAHFIFPGDCCPEASSKPFDGALGDGATGLFTSFMEIFGSLFDDNFSIPYIGIDLRARSQLGSLSSGFMLYGDKIIFHGSQVRANDIRFELLAKWGITEVIYAPSMPMTISPDQLMEAKGNSIEETEMQDDSPDTDSE